MLDPAADGLHNLPQRLVRNGKETLDAKNIAAATLDAGAAVGSLAAEDPDYLFGD
jgi:hypothetical protein